MRTAQIGELTGPVKTWNPSRTPEAEFDYIDLSAVDNIRKVITTTTRTIGADAPQQGAPLVTLATWSRQCVILLNVCSP